MILTIEKVNNLKKLQEDYYKALREESPAEKTLCIKYIDTLHQHADDLIELAKRQLTENR